MNKETEDSEDNIYNLILSQLSMSKEFSEETLNLLKGITIENLEKYSKVNAKSVLGKLIGTDPRNRINY